MVDIGHFSLVTAWGLSVYGVAAGTLGAMRSNRALVKSAISSVHLCTLFSLASIVALAFAFVGHDYRYMYVWQHSNNTMPDHYLVSAIWGGMDGSMLLWAVIMSLYGSSVFLRPSMVRRELQNWLAPVLSAGTGFFLVIVTFLTNPFRLVPGGTIPPDGNGLNPLLQNPSMMIHPPMLYAGFTGFLVPCAFCLAALVSGQLSDSWIRATRRWTLIAWGFLTMGIILGGNWAYIELGWGGFWAWDPVENASFLPWLTGTAYLHSVMVQEQKGMLKVWNVVLAVTTYMLTVFGTFLTRSGVVQSVHAFAETDVGWVFLLYIGIVSAITIVLIAYRWQELRPERQLESYFSREAAFLFNNLALLGICFSTFWGVLFPIFSEAVSGEKSVVGPPFFNQVNIPLFLALLFLMGVGPLIAWRRSNKKALVKTFSRPLIAGSIITAIFLWLDPTKISAAIAFGLSVFVLATIEAEMRRAVKARRQMLEKESIPGALYQVVRRRPRRYGGFMVHLGVAVMAVSITASMAYQTERDISLSQGQSVEVGRYNLTLEELGQEKFDNYTALTAKVRIGSAEDDSLLGYMHPERRAYVSNEEVTTEVDLRVTPREDLYLALAGLDVSAQSGSHGNVDLAATPALMKVFINPLQVWLWFGGVLVMIGTGMVLIQGAFSSELAATRQASVVRGESGARA